MNTFFRSILDALNMFLQTKFLFGGVGSIVAVLLLGHNFLGLNKEESIRYGLSGIAFYFVSLYIYNLWENAKVWFTNHFFDSIWGEGLILIQQIHEIVRLFEDGSIGKVDSLSKICNEVKKYFDKLTKKSCAVSIKLPIKPADLMELEVINVCRDDISAKLRDTEAYNHQKHFVFQNTAYMTIITRLSKGKSNATYINNDVDVEANYETTSLAAYANGVLPYKSEMVIAIRKYPLNRCLGKSSELMGFLCIDCSEKGGFSNDRYYICVANLIADSLFRIVKPIKTSE